MTMRSMRSGLRLLLGLSLIAGATSAALADPVVAATRATTSNSTISLNGINGNGSYNISSNLAQFWTKVGGTVGNAYGATGPLSGEFRTFCIDLYHTLSSNTMNFQNATDSVTNSVLSDLASPTHNRDMGKVGLLLTKFGEGVDTNSVSGPNSVNWMTVGALATLSTGAQRAAALQAAVWVAGFGVNSFTITGANVANLTAATNYLVSQIGLNRAVSGLIDYAPRPGFPNESPTSQDQAYAIGNARITAVPEPSTFAIAGLGALAFAGYGLRRRRAEGAAA